MSVVSDEPLVVQNFNDDDDINDNESKKLNLIIDRFSSHNPLLESDEEEYKFQRRSHLNQLYQLRKLHQQQQIRLQQQLEKQLQLTTKLTRNESTPNNTSFHHLKTSKIPPPPPPLPLASFLQGSAMAPSSQSPTFTHDSSAQSHRSNQFRQPAAYQRGSANPHHKDVIQQLIAANAKSPHPPQTSNVDGRSIQQQKMNYPSNQKVQTVSGNQQCTHHHSQSQHHYHHHHHRNQCLRQNHTHHKLTHGHCHVNRSQIPARCSTSDASDCPNGLHTREAVRQIPLRNRQLPDPHHQSRPHSNDRQLMVNSLTSSKSNISANSNMMMMIAKTNRNEKREVAAPLVRDVEMSEDYDLDDVDKTDNHIAAIQRNKRSKVHHHIRNQDHNNLSGIDKNELTAGMTGHKRNDNCHHHQPHSQIHSEKLSNLKKPPNQISIKIAHKANHSSDLSFAEHLMLNHHGPTHHKGFNCRFASQLYLLLNLSITLSLIYYNGEPSGKVGSLNNHSSSDSKIEILPSDSDEFKTRAGTINYLPAPSLFKISPQMVNSEILEPGERKTISSVVMSPLNNNEIGQKSRTDRSISTATPNQGNWPGKALDGHNTYFNRSIVDSNDFFDLFRQPFHSKCLIHYFISYLLCTSSLLLVLRRLFSGTQKNFNIDLDEARATKENKRSTSSKISENESIRNYNLNSCTRCKSTLDYGPVLLGSVSLGLIQLIIIGLEIAQSINYRQVYLPILKFIFVFFIMQYILARISDSSKSHNLTNFAIAHLLATQISLWLMRLNNVNDYYPHQAWINMADHQYLPTQNNRYNRQQTVWPPPTIIESGNRSDSQNNSGKSPIYMTSTSRYHEHVHHPKDKQESIKQVYHQSRSIEQPKPNGHHQAKDINDGRSNELETHHQQMANSGDSNNLLKLNATPPNHQLSNNSPSHGVKESISQQHLLGDLSSLVSNGKNRPGNLKLDHAISSTTTHNNNNLNTSAANRKLGIPRSSSSISTNENNSHTIKNTTSKPSTTTSAPSTATSPISKHPAKLDKTSKVQQPSTAPMMQSKQIVTSSKESPNVVPKLGPQKPLILPKPVITTTSLDENNRIINVTIRHRDQSTSNGQSIALNHDDEKHRTHERSVTTSPVVINKQRKLALVPPPLASVDTNYDSAVESKKSSQKQSTMSQKHHHRQKQPISNTIAYNSASSSTSDDDSNIVLENSDLHDNQPDSEDSLNFDGIETNSDDLKPLSEADTPPESASLGSSSSASTSTATSHDLEEIPDESFMFNEASSPRETLMIPPVYSKDISSNQLLRLVKRADHHHYLTRSNYGDLLVADEVSGGQTASNIHDNFISNSSDTSTSHANLQSPLSLKREQPSTTNTFTDMLTPIVHHYHILIIAILFNLWLNNSNESTFHTGVNKIRSSSLCSARTYPTSMISSNLGKLPSEVDKFRRLSYVACMRSMPPPPPRGAIKYNGGVKSDSDRQTFIKQEGPPTESSSAESSYLELRERNKRKLELDQINVRSQHKRSQSLESLDSIIFHALPYRPSAHTSNNWAQKHCRQMKNSSSKHRSGRHYGTRSSSMSLLSTALSIHQMKDLRYNCAMSGSSAFDYRSRSPKDNKSIKGFFVGMLVLSSAFIVLLLKNNILIMTTHSLIQNVGYNIFSITLIMQLISAVITAIGLVMNWRKRRSIRLRAVEHQKKFVDSTVSNQYDNYFFKSSTGNYIQEEPCSVIKESDSIIWACQGRNLDFLGYIFLLAAYYCGLSVSLESYQELSKLFITPSNDGWHAPAPVMSYLMLDQFSLSSTFIHLIIIFKGMMLIIQVTLQSIFIRVSCTNSMETKQIFAFLIFTNLSLWILEVSDQGVPWGSFDLDRMKLRCVISILVTLTRFYQALVFMQHWK